MESNIPKITHNLTVLAELTTRMDERLITIKDKQLEMDQRILDILETQQLMLERIAKLEVNNSEKNTSLKETEKKIEEIDKRLSNIEYISGGFESKWKTFSSYIVHLIWIIIACWILMKLNLVTPPIL